MAANNLPQGNGAGTVSSSGYRNGHSWKTAEELDQHLRHAESGVVRNAEENESLFRDHLADAKGTALGLSRQAEESGDAFATRAQNAITTAKESGKSYSYSRGS
jgi:hypothetical protein